MPAHPIRIIYIALLLFVLSCTTNRQKEKQTDIQTNMATHLLNRFIKYVKIDTESNEQSTSSPSTQKQLVLARLLRQELLDMGLNEVSISDEGILYASLPSNTDKPIPAIGFIAHLDTSPEISGKNVRPQIHRNYNGGDLVINKAKNIVIDTALHPEIKQYQGQIIITSDGTTLLGADDKAGIAIIMTAIEYLLHDSVPHGPIKIAFTPDEEIGRGTEHFDIKKFGAAFAYTIDGGEIGEIQFENFNAANAHIEIAGKNVHPGYAKGKIVNSITIGRKIDELLPNERPENTEGYEGYFHLIQMQGNVEKTSLNYLIRDHDGSLFERRKQLMQELVDSLNETYDDRIQLQITDSYYNMREKIEPVMHIVDLAIAAMQKNDIEPLQRPIRGGTDGAMLSHKGLPCPNLFTGGHNFHSRYEYIPLESMEKSVATIRTIIRLHTEKAGAL